jgi:L-rhamnose-H+ transport protein
MAVAVTVAQDQETAVKAPMLPNYLFSALAGTTWYMQFFFYTMGETQMGRYKFSSWTLHMASIIIFSTLWGIALNEWKGAGGRTRLLVGFSLLVLVISTIIVGYGNYAGSPLGVVSGCCPQSHCALNLGAVQR